MELYNIRKTPINLHGRKIFPGQLYGRYISKTISPVTLSGYNLTYCLESYTPDPSGYFRVSFWIPEKGWLSPCNLHRPGIIGKDAQFASACLELNRRISLFVGMAADRGVMLKISRELSNREKKQLAFNARIREHEHFTRKVDKGLTTKEPQFRGHPGYSTNPHVITEGYNGKSGFAIKWVDGHNEAVPTKDLSYSPRVTGGVERLQEEDYLAHRHARLAC